jgi:hypothetical protein
LERVALSEETIAITAKAFCVPLPKKHHRHCKALQSKIKRTPHGLKSLAWFLDNVVQNKT